VEGGKVKAKTAGDPQSDQHAGRALACPRQARRAPDGRDPVLPAGLAHIHIGEPRVTANFAGDHPQRQGRDRDLCRLALAAKEGLRLLDQEVFFREPVEHFQVFQNVVIWDEPAGVAGGRAGFCHKPAEAVARVIVGTVASMIADIVIDASHRDFEAQLLDLDQPRRPGRKSA
jgi:hypothetical protein